MKYDKMSYEEFEKLLENVKRSNFDEMTEYIEEVKKQKTENDKDREALLTSSDKIINRVIKTQAYIAENSTVSNAVDLTLGGLAACATPIVRAIGGEEVSSEYLKYVCAISGGAFGASVGSSILASKVYEMIGNRGLKKEFKKYLTSKFSSQVDKSLEATATPAIEDMATMEYPPLKIVGNGDEYMDKKM